MHPADYVLPPEREVDCDCPPAFHRPVMHDPTGWNLRVTACLHCGTLTVTESLVEEPHPNDVRCVGNRILDVAPDVIAWLDQWPRFVWAFYYQDRNVFLPAALRCSTLAEVEAAEQAAREALADVPPAQRLKRVGIPTDPPPASLPPFLKHFADKWRALNR